VRRCAIYRLSFINGISPRCWITATQNLQAPQRIGRDKSGVSRQGLPRAGNESNSTNRGVGFRLSCGQVVGVRFYFQRNGTGIFRFAGRRIGRHVPVQVHLF
jgi:hypothetical protein